MKAGQQSQSCDGCIYIQTGSKTGAYQDRQDVVAGQREHEISLQKRRPPKMAACELFWSYSVDSISKPQASRSGSGMYLEFLFRRAHSRKRVERMYWSGVSLNSFTACSNDVTTGITGPIGSGLPQLGLQRLFAILTFSCLRI